MRKPIIAGNWKMNKRLSEARSAAGEILTACQKINNVEIIIAPPAINILAIADAFFLSGTDITIAAQNCHEEKAGAYTGEISAEMIRAVGCKQVIIGHSERRKYFGETDETVNKKVKALIEAGLIPIICVGETFSQRQAGEEQALEVVSTQVGLALKDLSAEALNGAIIAYEPVWAIGTNISATPEQAQQVHQKIRQCLAQLYSEDFAEATRIIYGGSAKPENITELLRQPDIDGGLIGNASLDPTSFASLVSRVSELYWSLTLK